MAVVAAAAGGLVLLVGGESADEYKLLVLHDGAMSSTDGLEGLPPGRSQGFASLHDTVQRLSDVDIPVLVNMLQEQGPPSEGGRSQYCVFILHPSS